MDKTSLGDRMKAYEAISKNFLMRKTPVIIRLDGKAFHTFTKGLDKPFDYLFMEAMQKTMKYLCENIQGCVLGYTQSDEITLVLCDYQSLDTDAWFGYNVQKMTSVSASMAAFAFRKEYRDIIKRETFITGRMGVNKYNDLMNKIEKGAFFDSRAFSLQKEEVINCLIWRQQDATRNSIQSVGQSYFSHKELHGLKVNQIQDKLFTEKDINWNDYPISAKRGSCCIKNLEDRKWYIDVTIPIFTEDREYVNSKIYFD